MSHLDAYRDAGASHSDAEASHSDAEASHLDAGASHLDERASHIDAGLPKHTPTLVRGGGSGEGDCGGVLTAAAS